MQEPGTKTDHLVLLAPLVFLALLVLLVLLAPLAFLALLVLLASAKYQISHFAVDAAFVLAIVLVEVYQCL